jgi:hypothetical protein
MKLHAGSDSDYIGVAGDIIPTTTVAMASDRWFVAVAAGALMPGIATSISQIFSKVASVMTEAASQGS